MWSGRLALTGRMAIPVVYQIQVSASVLVEPQFSPWKIVFKQSSFNLISQGLHHPLGSFWPSSVCFTKDAMFTSFFRLMLTLLPLQVVLTTCSCYAAINVRVNRRTQPFR